MRKQWLKKVLALAVGTSLVAGTLAGCGDTEEGANASGNASGSESGGQQEGSSEEDGTEENGLEESGDASGDGGQESSQAAGMEGWTAFEENVTLKVPVYDRGLQGIPDVTDNYWTKWVQENFGDKYNVTVQYVPITRTAVDTDYALLASSENLPTILMEYDYPILAGWAGEGYLTEYDLEEFKQVAPRYYQQMEDNALLPYSELNGECYFAMALRPYANTIPNWITFYRMDWLKQVGYDYIPITCEDEIDALTKIKEAGIAEYPAGGEQTGLGYQVYREREFPMDELEWALYGDNTIPAMGWEPHREAVRFFNKKYNLGLMDPEYYVIDSETAKANFIAGKTWCFGAYRAADMELLNSFYQQNPDAELAVYTWHDEEGRLEAAPDTGYYPLSLCDNNFGMMVGFSSFATEDEIKAAWMYMEWMMDEEVLHTMQWGIEGENYTIVDGEPVTVTDYEGEYKMGNQNNKDYWCIAIEARNVGDAYATIEASCPKGYPQDFTDEIKAQYDLNVKRAERGYAITNALFGQTMEKTNEYGTKLRELYKEYNDELYMCAPEEFDALYDSLTQKYLEAGYQEVVDERREVYEAGNTTHLLDIQKKK